MMDRKGRSKPVCFYFNSLQYNYILQKEFWKDQQHLIDYANEKRLLKVKERQLWTNYLSQFGVLLSKVQ